MIVCEFIARNLPVEQGYYLADVSNVDPIAHREPNRIATSSTGWFLENARSRVINNEGFLHDEDYNDSLRTPLVVIVGDSQVAAPTIEFEDSIQARLSRGKTWATRFYTFAMSGAPLSQYVVWTKYANKKFNPDAVVFVISPNDFRESFNEAGLFDGFHYFVREPSGNMRLMPRLHRRTFRSKLVEFSSLIAYLVHNIRLPDLISSAFGSAESQSQNDIEFLIEWFFYELDELGLSPKDVAFVVGPIEDRVYLSETCSPSKPNWTVERFLEAISQKGFYYADLTEFFCRDYRVNGKELELPGDIHWNSEGHRVLADALSQLLHSLDPKQ